MKLEKNYEAAIASGLIINEPSQKEALFYFQTMLDALQKNRRHWLPWKKKTLLRGLYLYGPVGAGKTYLMDLFYHQLHEKGKVRLHFHHFMQRIDAELRKLQGTKNPLQVIAKSFASHSRVLCLDELLVNDVAHAMILAELFQALFSEGIMLVVTSNTAPGDLYKGGVQYDRFFPAITAINTHCDIHQLISSRDFRLGRELVLKTYMHPLGDETEALLEDQFKALDPFVKEGGMITVETREIPYIMRSEKAIWFEFGVLCNIPRSQTDYLAIAKRFKTVFISNIPKLKEESVQTFLLTHLIDVFYDEHIRLVLSSEVELSMLFEEGRLSNTFYRTYSRLQEMQSSDYIK
jgi:cell division protein ZapE